MLNDPQFIEAARVLAEKILSQESRNPNSIIDAAFQELLGRKPDGREEKICTQLFEEQLAIFKNDSGAVQNILSIGEFPKESKVPSEQLAAATMLLNTLMNHDEFVMKR